MLAGFSTVRDLNIEIGLASAHGRLHFYHRMLRRFAEAHSKEPLRLRERLATDNFADAHRLVHSLKSASASLVAIRVLAATARLELALKEVHGGSSPLELIENLEVELKPLVEAILALSI